MDSGVKWFDGYNADTGNVIDTKNYMNWPNPDFQMSVDNVTQDLTTENNVASQAGVNVEIVVPAQNSANLLQQIVNDNNLTNVIIRIVPPR